MRPFRSRRRVRRLALVAGALPLVVGAVLLPATAWAKVNGKPVQCRVLDGTNGGQWVVEGCTQIIISGAQGKTVENLSVSAPPSTITVQWGPRVVRGQTSLETTFSLHETPVKATRSRCPGGSEYIFKGVAERNSFTPGVKGHLKWFVCDTAGVIHDVGSTGKFPKPLRF